MAITIPRNSRLRFGRMLGVDGISFWDTLDLPEIPLQPDDLVHQVRDTDRIDLLAYRYYQDPRLWWVVAVANEMEDIPTHFNVGDQLRIPSPRYVTQVLFMKATVQSRI